MHRWSPELALGSILTSFTNAPGGALVTGTQGFGPYGNGRYYQGTINTAKGFIGQYNDSLTGLDYYNARYYDQVAGVFLSADTVQDNVQGMNPYAYVNGNPETLDDPTGHCAWYDLGCWGQQVVQGVQNFGNTLNNWGQQIGQATQNFVERVNSYGNLVSSYIIHFANSVVQGVVRTLHPLQGPRYALNTDEEFGGPGVGIHLTPPGRGHTIARHVEISLWDLADRAERDALRFRRTCTATTYLGDWLHFVRVV